MATKRAFSCHLMGPLWPAVARMQGENVLERRGRGRDQAERDKSLELDGAQERQSSSTCKPAPPRPSLDARLPTPMSFREGLGRQLPSFHAHP